MVRNGWRSGSLPDRNPVFVGIGTNGRVQDLPEAQSFAGLVAMAALNLRDGVVGDQGAPDAI